MTFKMPLPLPAVGVLVVSFPEFILKTNGKKRKLSRILQAKSS